jgi:pimeloyl-ACP methyl ester carboxylesterase
LATFLLIHGAWHGRWCWEHVTPLLEQQGHRVLAPDLPGMGSDPTPLDKVSVESWARFVADIISGEAKPVILVGHSRAGFVISRAAELARDRLLGLVYLAAFMPLSGQTLQELMQQIPPRAESAGSLIISPDGASSTIAPDAFERVFYNSTPPQLIARARALSCSEPMSSFTTPLVVRESPISEIPRFYIECTEDQAIALQLQRMMQDALPCLRTFTMQTDHSPFYSAPADLAAHLLTVAGELHQP